MQAANSELWEGLIDSGKKLLNTSETDTDDYSMWKDFPCEEWERSRVRLTADHFHQLPHAGQVTTEESDPEQESKALLVDI